MIPKVEACLETLQQRRAQDSHHRRPNSPFAAAGNLHEPRRRHRNRRLVTHLNERRRNDMATATSTMNRRKPLELFRAVRGAELHSVPGGAGARRRLARLGRPGPAVSRLLSRLGLQPARPLSAAGRRSDAGAGRQADPRAQHLAHRSPGPLGAAALASGALAARRSSATRAPKRTKRRSSWPGCTRRTAATRSSRFDGGFHGRTYGATSATAQPKYHEGIGPLLAGFDYAPFGDLDAVAKLIDNETCAILIEPIQGEGGIRIPPDGFLQGLRKLADEHELAADLRRSANRLRPHGQVVRLSALRRHARRHDAGQEPVRRHRRRGPADHGRNRPQPAARHARGHVRRQPDRRPRRHRHDRNDRRRRPARSGPTNWANVSASDSVLSSTNCELVKELRVCGLMIGLELTIDGSPLVQHCLDRGLVDQLHATNRDSTACRR